MNEKEQEENKSENEGQDEEKKSNQDSGEEKKEEEGGLEELNYELYDVSVIFLFTNFFLFYSLLKQKLKRQMPTR